jgi:DNA polymerase III delta prime subunit
METLKDKLYWEKYRPATLKNIILLPRIEAFIKDGIHTNMIFYGTPGTGKTTLANILAKNNNFLKINASKDNGIDVLRTKIEKYLQTLVFGQKEGPKIIYLDEFDRASAQLQDGLKSFMEEYNEMARFIFTTNHISKISKELKSRFIEVSFDPLNKQEREFMREKQVTYLRAVAKREEMEIYKDKESITKIVDRYFPDLRKGIETIQYIKISGDNSYATRDYGTDKLEFYRFVMDADINPVINYDYVMENFITDYDDAFSYLGRHFFEYLKEYHMDIALNKGASILSIQKEYGKLLDTASDPIIELINFIIDIKKEIKNN